MICPRTGDVCKCSDQEICTLDIAFINLGSPADAPVSIESSVEPSVSGMAMMVNRAPSREYATARMAGLSITADEFAAMARDAERLDWLDDLNKKFNERTGTTYGWKLDWTCNRWALSDCNLPALTVREAIDAAMAERNKEKS